MVPNFYHKVAAQALEVRLRHIDGDVKLTLRAAAELPSPPEIAPRSLWTRPGPAPISRDLLRLDGASSPR
jgi:hypothetical protein